MAYDPDLADRVRAAVTTHAARRVLRSVDSRVFPDGIATPGATTLAAWVRRTGARLVYGWARPCRHAGPDARSRRFPFIRRVALCHSGEVVRSVPGSFARRVTAGRS